MAKITINWVVIFDVGSCVDCCKLSEKLATPPPFRRFDGDDGGGGHK